MKHTWYKCPPDCDDYSCPYCVGGLASCIICGGAEGELTTDCCGHKLTQEIHDKVYAGKTDFKNHHWQTPTKR